MEVPTPFGTIEVAGEIRYCREIASQRLYYVGVKFVTASQETRDIVSLLAEHYRRRSVA